MADSVNPKFGYPGLKISYTCASAVLASRGVERVAGTRLVQHAGAGSLIFAGVAQHDVPATRASVGGPQVGDGLELTVIRRVVILVQFSAAVTEGQRLVLTANGQFAAAGVTPDARTVVGEAFEAVGAAGLGLALIY